MKAVVHTVPSVCTYRGICLQFCTHMRRRKFILFPAQVTATEQCDLQRKERRVVPLSKSSCLARRNLFLDMRVYRHTSSSEEDPDSLELLRSIPTDRTTSNETTEKRSGYVDEAIYAKNK